MWKDGAEGSGVRLKVFLVAAVAAAIAIGLVLPVPHRSKTEVKPQFATLELGRR